MKIDDTLFLIPARGGSKGLPRKNILPLLGKPMIYYAIDAAKDICIEENICVSTDDEEIKKTVLEYGLNVPFLRPSKLATDTAGSREVILHALDYYSIHESKEFSKICLLQVTSPLRTSIHIKKLFQLWIDELDMVVSVTESKSNPYYNLFEEDRKGNLRKSKAGFYSRRQDAPKVWQSNGAIYLINSESIRLKELSKFKKVRKYEMGQIESVDVDDELDYRMVELILKEKMHQ
ncbi:cytidylyltransferase domain-containing protein [Bacteroidota bacterium]